MKQIIIENWTRLAKKGSIDFVKSEIRFQENQENIEVVKILRAGLKARED